MLYDQVDPILDVKYLFDNLGCVEALSTDKISPVKIPVSFAGCGYVCGNTVGIVCDKRLVMTPSDCDEGWSGGCILIDGVPVLIIENKFPYEYSILDISSNKNYSIGKQCDVSMVPEQIRKVVVQVAINFKKRLMDYKGMKYAEETKERNRASNLIKNY